MRTIEFLPVLLLLVACGCNGRENKSNAISVTILPQKYFVQRIAGDKFEIQVMIPPGQCPETYEPTPGQMLQLSRSRLYFGIGPLPFEKSWKDKMAEANPSLKIVDTSAGVELIRGHHHCDGGHRHENGVDPHVWLSPKAVKIQAQHILEQLIAVDPANREYYEGNCQKFVAEIDELDRKIAELLRESRRKKFLVYHPAWSYFARDYGLDQIAIEKEGKTPSLADLAEFIDLARRENIRTILVQKQFDARFAQTIASEIGGTVVQIDPFAYDWPANLEKIAGAIRQALE